MKLSDLLRLLAKRTNLSYVAEQSLDERLVTIEAHELTIDEVMNMISRRLDIEVNRGANIYYLGTFRDEDRALLVRRVRRLDSNQIKESIQVLQSTDGRAVVYDDGLVVIGDKIQVLSRISNLLDEIEASDVSTWAIQYWLLSVNNSTLEELGLDIEPSIEVSLAFTESSAYSASSALARGGLDAILTATEETNGADLLIEHLSIIRDGKSQTFFEGDKFPIRVERVSNEGTSTTTAVEFVETGVSITSELREYSEETASLAVDVSLSEVIAIIDNFAPQTTSTNFDTESIIHNGGVYLLRSHKAKSNNNTTRNWLTSGFKRQDQERTIMLWVRCARIGAPIDPEDATQGAEPEASGQPIQPEPTKTEPSSNIKTETVTTT